MSNYVDEISPLDEYPNKMRFQDYLFMQRVCDVHPEFESVRPSKPARVGVVTNDELRHVKVPDGTIVEIAVFLERYIGVKPGTHLTQKNTSIVVKLRKAVVYHAYLWGWTRKEIARYFGFDITTVARLLKEAGVGRD